MTSFEPFPWQYLHELLALGYEPHWPTVLKVLKEDEEYVEQVTPCPDCQTSANDLTWIPVATCEESWQAGQGRVGYLTVCMPCRRQVSFLLEETCTEIEAETRLETGGSTFGVTWSRDAIP